MRVEHTVHSRQPIDRVWAFISDPKNDPNYIDACKEFVPVAGAALIPGAHWRRAMKVPIVNQSVAADVEITIVNAPTTFAYRARFAGYEFTETRSLVADGTGTRITFVLEGDTKGALKLGEKLAERQAKKTMEKDLAKLVDVLG